MIWELSGIGPERRRLALRIIVAVFFCLACYLAIQSTLVLAARFGTCQPV